MTAVANLARILIPIGVPIAAYSSCPGARKRWQMSKLYPPQMISQIIAVLFLLAVGAAWAMGQESSAKDISYIILTILIAASMLLNCRDAQVYRQMIANVAVFMVGFLIYTVADQASAEQVMLAPVVSVLLIDMVLAIQAMSYN